MERVTKEMTDTKPGPIPTGATQMLKVYELAKELNIDSITLIEKLKEVGIHVKSHMSALSAEELKNAKQHFTKAAKSTQKKSAVGGAEKKATTVIRRRAKSKETHELAEEQPQEFEESLTPQPQTPSDELASITQDTVPQHEVNVPTEEQLKATDHLISPEPKDKTTRPRSQIIITKKAEPAKPHTTEPTGIKRSYEKTIPTPSSRVYSSTEGSGLKMPSLLGARSAGQTTKSSSSIIKVIQEEPKKPSSPSQKIASTTIQPKSTPTSRFPTGIGGQIVSLGKEAIDRLVEEEKNFKKKGGAGRGEKEREADVKVSDYRAKKELVFLPKKKKIPLNIEIKHTEITTPAAHKRIVKIENAVSVSELAKRMGIKNSMIIQKLISMGVMATINQTLDIDTASLIATEYGYEVENIAFKEESVLKSLQDSLTDLKPRPPVVTVMGHVDHGKTSLLDAIRSAQVAASESGGITQHIGAYTVEVNNKSVTFIDTPGHEAFTMMRARGANVTDIVVLVVAADDGVMPQTREAIDHARAANVPIIVAVNKIDKAGANPEKVLKGLSELNLLPEAWGGDTIFANVSALKKTGIKELLENILLQAEVLELKANPNRPAEGIILEARLDRSRGPCVSVLVKKGTLKVGDSVVAGVIIGRIRALYDDQAKQLQSIGPGFAAEILGFEQVPAAGDTLNVVKDEEAARTLVEHRMAQQTVADAGTSTKMTLEELLIKTQQSNTKELPLILKTDVAGSAEAIKDSLAKTATDKVKVKVIHASTGGITESDVMLAAASKAIILGFNVRPDTKAKATAEAEKIEIKCYSIIYELLDEMQKAMAGVLEKKAVEKYLGRAEVRNTFNIPKIGMIAGCFMIDGKILRGAQVRLLRDNRVIYTGKLVSLRRFKDDVKEVAQGYECGIGIENYNDIKVGDHIEAFQVELVAQQLLGA